MFGKRIYAIDYLKGILILIVFMGHILPGILRETYPRYLIYSFHMPIFIVITGFLFKTENLETQPKRLFLKYWKRFIFPWIIAVVFFWITRGVFFNSGLSVRSLLVAFALPFYHLWYILGIISYISILFLFWNILDNRKHKWVIIIFISFAISCVSKWAIIEKVVTNMATLQLLSLIQHDFRLYNLFFFSVGMFIGHLYRNCEKICGVINNDYIEYCRILLCISVAIVTILFNFNNIFLENTMYYVMNLLLLFVLLQDSVESKLPHSTFLEFLGKYSLPLYLYHVFCKLFALYCFMEGSVGYYCCSMLSFAFGCILVYCIRNNSIAKRFFLGIE